MASKASMHAGNRCFLEFLGSETLFFGFSTSNIAFTLSKQRYKVDIEDFYDFDTIMASKASKHAGN